MNIGRDKLEENNKVDNVLGGILLEVEELVIFLYGKIKRI